MPDKCWCFGESAVPLSVFGLYPIFLEEVEKNCHILTNNVRYAKRRTPVFSRILSDLPHIVGRGLVYVVIQPVGEKQLTCCAPVDDRIL